MGELQLQLQLEEPLLVGALTSNVAVMVVVAVVVVKWLAELAHDQ